MVKDSFKYPVKSTLIGRCQLNKSVGLTVIPSFLPDIFGAWFSGDVRQPHPTSGEYIHSKDRHKTTPNSVRPELNHECHTQNIWEHYRGKDVA